MTILYAPYRTDKVSVIIRVPLNQNLHENEEQGLGGCCKAACRCSSSCTLASWSVCLAKCSIDLKLPVFLIVLLEFSDKLKYWIVSDGWLVLNKTIGRLLHLILKVGGQF